MLRRAPLRLLLRHGSTRAHGAGSAPTVPPPGAPGHGHDPFHAVVSARDWAAARDMILRPREHAMRDARYSTLLHALAGVGDCQETIATMKTLYERGGVPPPLAAIESVAHSLAAAGRKPELLQLTRTFVACAPPTPKSLYGARRRRRHDGRIACRVVRMLALADDARGVEAGLQLLEEAGVQPSPGTLSALAGFHARALDMPAAWDAIEKVIHRNLPVDSALADIVRAHASVGEAVEAAEAIDRARAAYQETLRWKVPFYVSAEALLEAPPLALVAWGRRSREQGLLRRALGSLIPLEMTPCVWLAALRCLEEMKLTKEEARRTVRVLLRLGSTRGEKAPARPRPRPRQHTLEVLSAVQQMSHDEVLVMCEEYGVELV